MTTIPAPPAADDSGRQQFLLEDVSWGVYEMLLRELEGKRVYLTYDDGSLELISPSPVHERWKSIIGAMIEIVVMELGLPCEALGSTTFRRKDLRKGLEPDECYYIQNEARIRGKEEIELPNDPPPDLVVEMDVTHRSLDREPIYRAMGVPELWRFDLERLEFFHLTSDGAYRPAENSRAFPFLPRAEVERFLKMPMSVDRTTILLRFRDWVRQNARR